MNIIGPGDIAAILTAVGLLVGAIAGAASKIGQCISDLRRQTARVQSTATQTRREVGTETAEIKEHVSELQRGLDRVSNAVFDRANVTDARINAVSERIRNLEKRIP